MSFVQSSILFFWTAVTSSFRNSKTSSIHSFDLLRDHDSLANFDMKFPQQFQSAVRRAYEHITLSKCATLWFCVVFAHWAIQVALQAVTYTDNASAKYLVTSFLDGARLPIGTTMLVNDTMQTCDSILDWQSATPCQIIAKSTTSNISERSTSIAASMFNSTLPNGTQVMLNSKCVYSLSWIEDVLHEAKIEDVVTLCFQFWLFVVSLLAIMVDSIPHLSVSVASHILDTAWAGFRMHSTIHLREQYNNYVVQEACDGLDILGTWWDIRARDTILIIACNGVSLVLIIYLSWKLFRSFVGQTFARVGASPVINRAYKLLLCFEASLGLVGFFALASILMWICVVFHDTIDPSKPSDLARTASVIIAVTIPFLVLTGGISVHREIKWLFPLFGILQFLILVLWTTTFASDSYLQQLRTWPFFASTSITSFIFLVSTAALGIACRFNFDKGLAHFLWVQAELDSADFTPDFFINDRKTGTAVGSHFSLTPDHRASLANFDNDVKRGSVAPRQIPFPSKRSSVAGASFYQEEHNNLESAPWYLNLSGESEFELPIPPAPPFALPWRKRRFTPSTATQSTTGSAGIVTYASYSSLKTATARTIECKPSLVNQ